MAALACVLLAPVWLGIASAVEDHEVLLQVGSGSQLERKADTEEGGTQVRYAQLDLHALLHGNASGSGGNAAQESSARASRAAAASIGVWQHESPAATQLPTRAANLRDAHKRCREQLWKLEGVSTETQQSALRAYCEVRLVLPSDSSECASISSIVAGGLNATNAEQICTWYSRNQAILENKAVLLQEVGDDLTGQERDVLQNRTDFAFRVFDSDKNGNLERKELFGLLRDDEENTVGISEFFILADADGDDSVTRAEFLRAGTDIFAHYKLADSGPDASKRPELLLKFHERALLARREQRGSSGGGSLDGAAVGKGCQVKDWSCVPYHPSYGAGPPWISGSWGSAHSWGWKEWGGVGQCGVGGITVAMYNGAGWHPWTSHCTETPKQDPRDAQVKTHWCVQARSCDAPSDSNDIFHLGPFGGFGCAGAKEKYKMTCRRASSGHSWYGVWRQMSCNQNSHHMWKKLGWVGKSHFLYVGNAGYDAYTSVQEFEGPTDAMRAKAWLSWAKQMAGHLRSFR